MKIFIVLLLCFFCTSIVNAQDTNTVQSSSKEKGNALSKKAEPSTGIEDFFKEFVSHLFPGMLFYQSPQPYKRKSHQ